MLNQDIQENTQNLGEFLNVREPERYSMPLALSFYFKS